MNLIQIEYFIEERDSINNIEKIKTTKLLSIESPAEKENVRLISLLIGDYNKVFNVILDTGSHITWFKSTASNSNTKKSLDIFQTLIYGSGQIEIGYYTDIITLKPNSSLSFLMSIGIESEFNNKTNLGIDGIVGLSYGSDKAEEYDFIFSLLRSKIISNDYFSILEHKNNKTGVFLIGEKPALMVENENKGVEIPFCNIDPYNYKFKKTMFYNCILNGLSISDIDESKIVIFNKNLIFDSGSTNSFLPSEMYYYIISTFLKKYIDLGTCRKINEIYKCDNPSVLNFGTIFFIYGKYSIGIEFSKLFNRNGWLTIRESKSILILGSFFFDNVLISFSRKEKRIEMINQLTRVLSKDYSLQRISFVNGLLIGISFLIFLLILLVLMRRRFEYETYEKNSNFSDLRVKLIQ